MHKKIRKTALILSHVGVLLSIVFLIFALACSVRANRISKNASDADAKDLYLAQAIHERDFSIYSVGKALSDHTDPARETFLLILDLIIPVLLLVSGILLQIGTVRPRKKNANAIPKSSTNRR